MGTEVKFKVGDKVFCVDASNAESLELFKNYTVRYYDDDISAVWLDGDESGWHSTRFRHCAKPCGCTRELECVKCSSPAVETKTFQELHPGAVEYLPNATVLPTDPAERKGIPVATGFLDYFPNAIIEVAKVSRVGNDQHNPGQPLHHNRGKSTDHADTAIRHFMERGTVDKDGQRHTAKAVWRMLAALQEEMEAAGAPLARGAKL